MYCGACERRHCNGSARSHMEKPEGKSHPLDTLSIPWRKCLRCIRTTTTTTKQTSYDENSFHHFRDTHVDISLLLCSIRIPFYTIDDGGIVRRLLTLKCRWHHCWMCMHHCHIRQILGKFCPPPSIPFVL